jgi:hypothetical protein
MNIRVRRGDITTPCGPKAVAGRPKKIGTQTEPISKSPTLASSGISKNLSSRALATFTLKYRLRKLDSDRQTIRPAGRTLMNDWDDHTWLHRVGLVYSSERALFVRIVNSVLNLIEGDPLALMSLHSESIPKGERLTERIDDFRNEWLFRFAGRKFRLCYTHCFKSESHIALTEVVADNFETYVAKQFLSRSDDTFDNPRIDQVSDALTNHVQLFCEMLAMRFPQGEQDSFRPA